MGRGMTAEALARRFPGPLPSRGPKPIRWSRRRLRPPGILPAASPEHIGAPGRAGAERGCAARARAHALVANHLVGRRLKPGAEHHHVIIHTLVSEPMTNDTAASESR
jgi:hypothetical protein